jgi:hypothetical protein
MDNEKMLRWEVIPLYAMSVVIIVLTCFAFETNVVLGIPLSILTTTTAGICLNSAREFKRLRERIEELERQLPPPAHDQTGAI